MEATNSAATAAAGACLPEREKAPGAGHTTGAEVNNTAEVCGSRDGTKSDTNERPEWKREADLIARAALSGIRVHRSTTDDGRPSLIASKWALCREFTDLGEFGAWLDRVTGRKASGTPAA